MLDYIEIRTHSYANKTGIVHIDRRNEFRRKKQERKEEPAPIQRSLMQSLKDFIKVTR